MGPLPFGLGRSASHVSFPQENANSVVPPVSAAMRSRSSALFAGAVQSAGASLVAAPLAFLHIPQKLNHDSARAGVRGRDDYELGGIRPEIVAAGNFEA